MMSNLDAIEIYSEKESPSQPTTIEEEVMIMPIGSSLIPKIKRQAKNPSWHVVAEEAHPQFG